MVQTTRKNRRNSLKDKFSGIQPGEIRSFHSSEINYLSARARAYELNRAAGYMKFTVSKDWLTDTVRIVNNDEP